MYEDADMAATDKSKLQEALEDPVIETTSGDRTTKYASGRDIAERMDQLDKLEGRAAVRGQRRQRLLKFRSGLF